MRIQPPSATRADFSDTMELQKRFLECADKLAAMANEVAIARQVREYDNDRRKRALAVVAAPLIAAGSSSAGAEMEARASTLYETSMKQLGGQLLAAEKTLAEYEGARIQWETARSLLALTRDQLKNL